jgi:hypothetical protein
MIRSKPSAMVLIAAVVAVNLRRKIRLVTSYAFLHTKTGKLIPRNSKHIYGDRTFWT